MRRFLDHFVVALTVGLALSSCQDSQDVERQRELIPELAAQMSEIESTCGLPPGALAGTASASLEISKIACVSEEAKNRNLKIGFISNPVDPDAQTH